MKRERNPNIELWRCFCMFAVVLGHVLANNKICTMNGYVWHIPGFLLISGYFGINFSVKKVLKLIGIAYACYWLTIPFREWTGFVSLLLPHGGWFLPFYCVLMLMSTLLNVVMENTKSHRAVILTILALVFIGWLPTLSVNAHLHMIAVPGMQGSGIMLMIATYISGAMLNKYEIANRQRAYVWLILFVIGIASSVFVGYFIPNACHYLSPISLVTAVCGFMFFVSAPKLPLLLSKIVNLIAPSMFGIYIIHECSVKRYQYLSGGGVMDAIVRAVLLFMGCVAIDMVRRGIGKCFDLYVRKGDSRT